MTWEPERYLAFADHRTRPAADLLARIALERPARIADLGCGPGNSTALLCARWPDAELVGIDNAPKMLHAARASGVPARWLEADIADWTPDDAFDLIFSNAALHWVPDHARLLPRLLGHLRAGGVLAIQMPRNFRSPAHRLLREVAATGPWATRLEGRLPAEPVAAADWYYDLLRPHGALLDLWETEYLHVLDGDDAVFHWVRGTAMRPVIGALADDELVRFEAAYRERLHTAYAKRADGRTLFPFRRLFLVATRGL